MYTLLPTVTQSQRAPQPSSSKSCSTRPSKPSRSARVIPSLSIDPSLKRILDSCSLIGHRISKSLRKPPSLPIQPCVLHPFQLQGVQWLHTLYRMGINGILADEMGLGKTIQTLVFLSLLPQPQTLIIVPTSLLSQWRLEIEKWCTHLRVMVYSGCQQERKDLRRQFRKDPQYYNVILTTLFCRDSFIIRYSLFERNDIHDDRDFIYELHFDIMILDEGHCIKNPTSKRFSVFIH